MNSFRKNRKVNGELLLVTWWDIFVVMTSLILRSLPSGASAPLGNKCKINDVVITSRSYQVTVESFPFYSKVNIFNNPENRVEYFNKMLDRRHVLGVAWHWWHENHILRHVWAQDNESFVSAFRSSMIRPLLYITSPSVSLGWKSISSQV